MPNDTLIKLSSRVPQASSLDGHADQLYRELGKHRIAIVDLRVADRTEVDPDSDASPRVKIEVNSIEVAWDAETENRVRELMQEIYRERTASGTFDSVNPDNGEVHRTAQDGDAAIPITGAGRRKPTGGGGRGPRG